MLLLQGKFSQACDRNEALKLHMSKAVDDLGPLRVYNLFKNILDFDIDLLIINCKPESLLLTSLSVPPVCIRPTVELDGG